MDKPQIRIIDNQFGHGTSIGSGDLKLHPERFDWYRGADQIGDIIVFSEDSFHMVNQVKEKIKIGFILESPLIKDHIYKFIANPDQYNKFDYIFTFDKDLINLNPNKFIYYTFGGCWIYPKDRMVYEKTKNISIISSQKRITAGHQLRHDVIARYRDSIDGVYGGGYKFVENKLEALKDYRYSIIIENDNCDAMFSEKLIDCFITGTIPIYWGCKSIGDFFNKKGMFCFSNAQELESILKNCTEQNYLDNIDIVKENFENAKKYVHPEDYMWDNLLKNLIK